MSPCASGLTCSFELGTCQPDWPASPDLYCSPEETGCGDTQSAFHCYGGQTPGGAYLANCKVSKTEPTPGEALYCCDDVPHCDTIGTCGPWGTTIDCNDPVVPQDTDPALKCAVVYSIDHYTSYCCSTAAACFAVDLFACGDAGQSYACTGDASPAQAGLSCTPGSLYDDAGTSGTYCCAGDGGAE